VTATSTLKQTKIIDFSIFIRFRSVASFIYYFLMCAGTGRKINRK
jgi:hypothetical protein